MPVTTWLSRPHLRSILAEANEAYDGRIFADFAHWLIQRARALYVNDRFAMELESVPRAESLP
jgi:hypothetical protein